MPHTLLIIRFSAMGDVAMTVPVVRSVALANPDISIIMLTRNRMAPMFSWMPNNVKVMGINLNDYKGMAGLERLYRELSKEHIDAVADLHDVLRTKYIRTRFRMNGVPVKVINKGRKDKKALIGHSLDHAPLMPMMERYRDVFRRLSLKMHDDGAMSVTGQAIPQSEKEGIGIAPFAAHHGKVYPLDEMRKVVDMLADAGNKVYLFGSPGKEAEILSQWQRNGVESVAGKMGGLKEELELMSRLKLMISMDSSNMHMAAMMGTQTISVWGATHPKAGFMAWNQTEDSAVQIPMKCRPCSIYGNKPCHEGNYPCLSCITPQMIVNKARLYGAK